MMIVDAIRSATTRHAVMFLVTAYIESLRHFERASGAPAKVLELPIDGEGGIDERMRMLHQHTGVPFESMVAVSELAAVLACALERLSALAEPAPTAGVMPHARTDSRRSALSV